MSESLRAEEVGDQHVVRAIAWTGLGKYTGQVFRWGATFLVARILTPSDYGLVGMTGLFSGLVYLLSEFGIGAAVLKMRELDAPRIARLNGLAVTTGLLAMAIGFLAAAPLAAFFGRPEMKPIVMVSSVGFLLSSLQSVRTALLQRDMQFKLLAKIEFVGAILVASLVLIAAKLGFGYWSLVVPSLVSGLVTVIWLNSRVSVSLAFPDIEPIREAAKFSAWVFAGRLGNYFFFTSDFLVVGRVLGDSALGGYQFAWGLANTPNDQVNGLVARVSGSFYSAMQDDRPGLGTLFLSLLSAVSTLSVPMVLGLAVVAPEFISVFLGEKWVVAVRPLQILCAFNAIRVIPILASPVLQIVDEVRFQAITTMVGLAYMPLAFYFGAKAAGAEGVAFAWLVAYPPLLLLIAHRTVRALGLRLIDIPRAIFPSILSGLCMVAVVVTVRGLLAENMSDVIRLFALIACGALAYVLVMFVLFRTRIEEFRRTVSVLRR